MTQANGNPPTFQGTVHEITISAEKQSKVTGVTVYSVRAEVTREVSFDVETGQNKVMVTGLPTSLSETSLRVDGRGAGTIQGVTVSYMPSPPVVTTSDAIVAIKEKQDEIEAAIGRCKRNRDAVYKYLETLSAQHVDGSKLSGIIAASEDNLENLDKKMASLRRELDASRREVEEEKKRLNPPVNKQLTRQVEVGLFADREGPVVLVLTYALSLSNANWDAGYDVRVNTQTKEKPVKLVYQAKIKQSTGENWDNVPLLLETNAPTFGVTLPDLRTWSLEVKEKPKPVKEKKKQSFGGQLHGLAKAAAPTSEEKEEESDDDMGFGLFGDDDMTAPAPALATTVAAVHNQGAVSTTYKIPGLVSIPSDGQVHTITIVELELDAELSWVTVPQVDARVFLQARIENTSDYILLSGEAAIYVDGAFNSRSTLRVTRPQEKFDFSLGVDATIRVTHHPRVEKSSKSGLITKTLTKTSTQRITVQNTKLTAISRLKVIDRIPVSKDSRIAIKLKTPELALPSLTGTIQRTLSISGTSAMGGSVRSEKSGNANGDSSKEKKKLLPAPTKISENPPVCAQWHGADEENMQIDALGQDGRINWIISELGSMEVVNLVLSWEVGVLEGVDVLSNIGFV